MFHDRTTQRLVIAAIVTAATLAVPRESHAQSPTVQTTVPIAAPIVNECNGETVQFSGTASMLVHFSQSSTGSTTSKNQLRIQGSGVGLVTGNEYRVFQITDNETTAPAPTANLRFEQTATHNTDVNGHGPEDHFILQLKSHFTITPGGLLTAFFQDFKTCCPGGDGTLSCQPIMF